MKALVSMFRIKLIAGLQYRAAAWAGLVTNFAWGLMMLLMYRAFYTYNAAAFPMPFESMATYIWLQEGLLGLFVIWQFDEEVFSSIETGGVAYEMCRPVDLYGLWFIRNLATRCASALMRVGPIFVVAALLPAPYGLGLPVSWQAFVLFLGSLAMGVCVLVAFGMLIYLSAFYMLSARGIRILAVSVVEFLSGAYVPLPFFPEVMQKILLALPFASTQSTPYLLYIGYYRGTDIGWVLLLQVFWLVVLMGLGRLGFRRALNRVVVQGG